MAKPPEKSPAGGAHNAGPVGKSANSHRANSIGGKPAPTATVVPKVRLELTRDSLPPVFETGASTIPPLRLAHTKYNTVAPTPRGGVALQPA